MTDEELALAIRDAVARSGALVRQPVIDSLQRAGEWAEVAMFSVSDADQAGLQIDAALIDAALARWSDWMGSEYAAVFQSTSARYVA
jgi:hypothetical protein